MLNGSRYQCPRDFILNILSMQSTTKDDGTITTTTIVTTTGSSEGNQTHITTRIGTNVGK
jgi:hypothetical protein